MSQKRNLGPILALTGAGIAIAAVIAGFIVVGGPGATRDRRLDQMTMQRVTTTLNLAHCAYDESGVAPRILEAAADVAIQDRTTGRGIDNWATCALGLSLEDIKMLTTPSTTTAGGISYEPISNSRIRICANFRQPSHPTDLISCQDRLGYPTFQESHPAGVHCYEVEMIKGMSETPSCNYLGARPSIYQ